MARMIHIWIPKWLFWSAVCLNGFLIVIGALYLFAEIDLPYVNSGDRGIVYGITILWWFLTTIAVLGWKYDGMKERE